MLNEILLTPTLLIKPSIIHRTGTLVESGIAQYTFDTRHGGYNLIWVQWAVMYVNDRTFVAFFRRAAAALAKNKHAYIVIKDNVLAAENSEDALYHHHDQMIVRSDGLIRSLLTQAGLEVVREMVSLVRLQVHS